MACGPVWAQAGISAEHTGIELSAETFTWNFIQGGSNVQEEVGQRVRLGMSWDNFRRRTFGWVYSGEADFMVGIASHENFTTVPTTERDVNYAGIHAEGQAGIHFGTIIGVNLLAGLGLDGSARLMKEPTAGVLLPDTDEYWYVIYSKFGLGISNDFTSGHWRAEAGVKAPIYVKTIVNVDGYDDVSFEPKKRGSIYAQFKINFGQVGKTHFGLAVYFDSYNFGDGGTETLSIGGVPTVDTYTIDKSEMRTVGVRLGYFF